MLYINLSSFAVGILLEDFFELGVYPLLLLLTTILALLAVLRKEKRSVKILTAFLFLSLGMLRMTASNGQSIDNLKNFSGEEISFESTILSEPDVRESSTRYIVHPERFTSGTPRKCLARLTEPSTRNFSAEKYPCISEESPSEDFKQRVLLVADRFPEFEYGDKVSVSGTLETPENFLNENGVEFNYISYLKKDGIYFLMHRPEISKMGEGDKNFLVSSLYGLKNSFVKNIERVVPEPNSSLLAGILVGAKNSLGENLLEKFRNVGLIHIIVLSGYNITIVIYATLKLTSKIDSRSIRFSLALITIATFAIMVGLGATVIRASVMAAIAILAKYYGRESDALRALFIAGLAMLLWNPLTLTSDPSFQLSFMATLGLILFSPIVENYISKQKILSKILPAKWHVREIAASTLAVQLFLLPILVRMSGSFSLISFFINILVLPIVPTLMLFGFLTGILGFIPFLGSFISWVPGSISYILSEYIIVATDIGSNLPLSTIKTGGLPVFIVLIWYIGSALVYRKFTNE
jgi:competence protein ComEC